MGENDRAWCSREKGAPKHAQTCARADTHVQIHPRARARASPRGAGDKRDGQVAAQTWRKRCRRQRRRRSPRPSRRRRGPGTRSGRVVDVREARERVTTGRGVERGRPASAGRRAQAGPESCDPGALGVPRALAEGPMATACGVPSRARRPGAREGGNRAGARRGGRQGPRTGSPIAILLILSTFLLFFLPSSTRIYPNFQKILREWTPQNLWTAEGRGEKEEGGGREGEEREGREREKV